jgi:hypothetical protein
MENAENPEKIQTVEDAVAEFYAALEAYARAARAAAESMREKPIRNPRECPIPPCVPGVH